MNPRLLVLLFFIALASAPIPAGAQTPDGQTSEEVSRLLATISSSGCTFNRNGTWYQPEEAAQHINKKYQYALKKGLITSTENFIEYAATKSSLSGKPYLVKCGVSQPVPSSEWLSTKLTHIREQR